MRRPHRLLLALSSAALMTGGAAPLWGANVTSSIDIDATPVISADSIVFDTTITNTGTPQTLIISNAKRLVIETANGAVFDQGVVISDTELEIGFKGPVTFNLSDAANTMEIGRLAFEGSDEADAPDTLTVNGELLTLGNETKVSLDKNLHLDFNGPGGIDTIADLRLGEKNDLEQDTRLTFDENSLLTATKLSAGSTTHTTVIGGPIQIGVEADDFEQGLTVTESITVNGDITIEAALKGAGDSFIFNQEASIILTEAAAGSELAPETSFSVSESLLRSLSTIDKEVAVTAFKPFEMVKSENAALMRTYRDMIETLALSDSLTAEEITEILDGGELAYDKDSGYVVFANYDDRAALDGVPAYGVPFVQALDAAEEHKALAVFIKGAAKATDVSGELNTLMGNVPNAAISAALSGNTNQAMAHLNSTLSPTMPGFAGPAGNPNGLWITPAYGMADISGSPQEGYTDLEITNPSVTLGYDRWINDRIRLGVFAALGQPETESNNDAIKSDTLQAGLYGQAQLNYGINVNAAVAYSRQSHEAERQVMSQFLAGYDQVVSASFDGDALSAALEVSRLYPVGANTFVRPTIGYSYVAASMDGYTEESDIDNPGNSLAQKVDATDFTMHLVRVGAEGGWSNDLTTITGRLFWVGNMGDTQPQTQATLISDGTVPFTLTGAEYDKNMINVGLGVTYVPPQTRGLTLGLNYDALLGSNAKSHNLSLMARYEF